MADRKERIREIVWQHLEAIMDTSISPHEQMFFGLILWMRPQDSDPKLCKGMFEAT
jgi:hypothetical protein